MLFFEPQDNIEWDVETKSLGHWRDEVTRYELKIKGNVSPFRKLVWDECLKKTFASIQGDSLQEFFNATFDENSETVQSGFSAVVKESVPAAINSYFESIVNSMQFMNNLRDNNPNITMF